MGRGKKTDEVNKGANNKPVKASTAKKTSNTDKDPQTGEIGIGMPVNKEQLKKMKDAAAKHKSL